MACGPSGARFHSDEHYPTLRTSIPNALTHCQASCLFCLLQAEAAARILRMYREGLIPESAGACKAGLAAYGNYTKPRFAQMALLGATPRRQAGTCGYNGRR